MACAASGHGHAWGGRWVSGKPISRVVHPGSPEGVSWQECREQRGRELGHTCRGWPGGSLGGYLGTWSFLLGQLGFPTPQPMLLPLAFEGRIRVHLLLTRVAGVIACSKKGAEAQW